jgi:3-methylcrotonyl-CoA carboxylase alpha subunit
VLPPQSSLAINGHAVEARLYAEDPARGFLPSIGTLKRLGLPVEQGGIRVDTGVRQGDAVTMFYDPMIAKVIAHGATRGEAAQALARAMEGIETVGVKTNAAFVANCLRHGEFLSGEIDTGFIDRHLQDLAPKPSKASAETHALAAVAVLLNGARTSGGGAPWAIDDGFRIGGDGFDTVDFADGDKPLEVRIERSAGGFAAAVGERRFDIAARLTGDRLTGSIAGRAVQAWVDVAPQSVTLAIGAVTTTLALYDPLDIEDVGASAGNAVVAPMPGKIIQVHAEAGKPVKRGAALAVLEAMKMEHTITAPGDKTVAEVLVKPGDQVTEGAVLIRFAEG